MTEGDFVIESEEFRAILEPDSKVEKIADGFGFTEGPVWMGDHLIFSDLRKDRLHRWSPEDGLSVFREPTGRVNGNTRDHEGRLVTAGHASRNLQRTEHDGSVTILADHYDGMHLSSPNDLVVKSDGSIWFTDPPFMVTPEEQELPLSYVFRFDPANGDLTPVTGELDRPNGLCFSPDESLLYIADSARKHVRVFTVVDGVRLEGGEIFCDIEPGIPDGMRVDTEGRLYSTALDGVHLYSTDGKRLGKILTPETAANCSFGGDGDHTLFITASTQVHAVTLAAAGVPGR